jgi:RimJ/RimL family protein N-acetyltransferase
MTDNPVVSVRLAADTSALTARLDQQIDVQQRIGGLSKPPAGSTTLVIEVGGEAIGIVAFNPIRDSSAVEMLCAILTAHQCKGYGRVACRLAIAERQTSHPEGEILGFVVPSNQASWNMVQSLGFQRTGQTSDRSRQWKALRGEEFEPEVIWRLGPNR